eukprot:11889067-Alexandrium_andersonii.AAC.1
MGSTSSTRSKASLAEFEQRATFSIEGVSVPAFALRMRSPLGTGHAHIRMQARAAGTNYS